jgi:TRAP-type uncharacterized transport system substrate-binding protein
LDAIMTGGARMQIVSFVALASLFVVAVFAPASAQVTASIGTNPVGSVFDAIGSGLAKVTTEHSPVRLSVEPYTGKECARLIR